MFNPLSIFKPVAHIEPIKDKAVIDKTYFYWRLRIFYSVLLGYAFFYFTRKSFNAIMPTMIEDLGFLKSDLAIVGTVLYFSYGLSKFLSGIVSDRSNPRYFMSIGLILTGVCNILFGLSSSILLLTFFWGINGFFQGWGWPPITRLMTHWYSKNERGRWWSTCNIAHNLGGGLIPVIAVTAATYFGSWRWGVYVPAVLSIGYGLILMNRLRDTPQSLGLPSIEDYRNDYSGVEKKKGNEKELTTKEIIFKYVLKNKSIWLLAIAYIFVYIVRTGIDFWAILLLTEKKGYTLFNSSLCIMVYEAGGLVGNLAAGWFSDLFFRAKRGPVNVIFSLGILASLSLFWYSPVDAVIYDVTCMFLIGFFVFGPQMLIGVAAAELSHKKAAATAVGFTGFFAYWGSSLSLIPIGKVADHFGWDAVLLVLMGSSFIAFLLLTPLWSKEKEEEPQEAKAAA